MGNVSIHSQKEQRYNCDVCRETFAARKVTIFYRLKTDPMVVMLVITLLAHGCPIQAIVAADSYAATLFGLQPDDLSYIQAGAAMGLGRNDLGNLKIEEIAVGG